MEHITFHDYWRILSPDGKQDLATKLHTSQAYLSQIAHGHRNPSKRLVELANIVTNKSLEFPGCCED